MLFNVWKKSNICRIEKKGVEKSINNYKSKSLLSVCGKIFKRLILNSMNMLKKINYCHSISLAFSHMTHT